jgi:V/A-type H+/Na+-transporting ATPase subunit E
VEVHTKGEDLEREILEDARRKAARILESADKELSRSRAEWAEKLSRQSGDAVRERQGRLAALRERMETAIPLDLMRVRLGFLQETLARELTALIGSLTDAEVLRSVGVMLVPAASAFDGQSVVVTAVGIAVKDAEAAVRAALPKAKIALAKAGDAPASPSGRGVVVETEDRKTRFRGTLDELEEQLLDEHREALAAALFGKETLAAMSVESR